MNWPIRSSGSAHWLAPQVPPSTPRPVCLCRCPLSLEKHSHRWQLSPHVPFTPPLGVEDAQAALWKTGEPHRLPLETWAPTTLLSPLCARRCPSPSPAHEESTAAWPLGTCRRPEPLPQQLLQTRSPLDPVPSAPTLPSASSSQGPPTRRGGVVWAARARPTSGSGCAHDGSHEAALGPRGHLEGAVPLLLPRPQRAGAVLGRSHPRKREGQPS